MDEPFFEFTTALTSESLKIIINCSDPFYFRFSKLIRFTFELKKPVRKLKPIVWKRGPTRDSFESHVYVIHIHKIDFSLDYSLFWLTLVVAYTKLSKFLVPKSKF